MLLPAYILF
ncbi:hypothetical protein EC960932_4092, partial [Escherichia coli 96.0932]